MKAVSLLIATVLAAVPLLDSKAVNVREAVTYGCNDVVVVGRVQNLSYTAVDSEDDLLGHGVIAMRVTVGKLLKGRERRRVVPVTTIAHTYMRDDRDFLLVLTPATGDAYTVRTASLWEGRQRHTLAAQCG